MEVRKNTVRTTMDSTDQYHHHDAAFCLPTHFLSDDDFLSGAGDSPVSSSQTQKDHELLDEFTRQLARSSLRDQPHHNSNPAHEKPWMFSTSPQSTLTGLGPWSPNGPSRVPSPPLTPPGAAKRDAAWELLYEAAGHVARLKMNAMAAQLNLHHHQQNRGLPRNSSSLSTNQYQQQLKRQGREREEWYCQHHQQSRASGGGALGLPQSAWTPVRGVAHHRQQSGGGPPAGSDMRAVFLGGRGSGSGHTAVAPVKRQSTGTGVFIPLSQRVGTTQPEPPRKKPTGCSTVLLPARVVQALNLDLEEINNNGVNRNSHSRFGSGFLSDHDVMIARRNAVLSQQRRSMKAEGGATATMVGGGHDIRLPSDWTY